MNDTSEEYDLYHSPEAKAIIAKIDARRAAAAAGRLTLSVALLGVSLAATAEPVRVIASVANEAGGEILLLSVKCPGKEALMATTTQKGGYAVGGCAMNLPPDRILINWENNLSTVIPVGAFAKE